MKKLAFTFALVCSLSVIGLGQKYGHINLGNLITAFPETKAADAAINSYSQQLIKQGEAMAQQLQEDYVKAINKVQEGTLSPIQQQELEKSLTDRQGEIQRFELEVQQKVAQKREELLKPILERVEKAIAAVAKEKGYVMVFDTSVFNAVLFTEESDDLMASVKAKLGIQ